MPFYCSNIPSKMFYGSIGAEFLRISRATSKTEDLTCNWKQLLGRMLKQNGQMRKIKFSLIKIIQRHQKVLIKYSKSTEEVMQAIGFYIQSKTSKSNIFFYIHFLQTLHSFPLFFIYYFIISNKYFSTSISLYLYIFMFIYIYFYIFLYTSL